MRFGLFAVHRGSGITNRVAQARVVSLLNVASIALVLGGLVGWHLGKLELLAVKPATNHDSSESITVAADKPEGPPSNESYCAGHDEACCLRIGPEEWRTHRVVDASMVNGIRARIAVHPSHDIVSSVIASSREWEREKTSSMHAALKKLGPNSSFVDVGANIGWFSLAYAYAGYKVYAIEPFQTNVEIMQHSLCLAPPEVRERLTILQYGLGGKDGGQCELWQDPRINKGDTFIVCSPQSRSATVLSKTNHEKLGTVNLMTLDTLVAEGRVKLRAGDAVVMKMDTEGFEPHAIQGASKFLTQIHPAVIYSEFSESMIKRVALSMDWDIQRAGALPETFLEAMRNAGYKLITPISKPAAIDDIVFVSEK